MTTIPADHFVDINPTVLPAGGSALDLSGLVLTDNNRVPIGTVQSFPSATAVGDFFGGTSTEKTLADKYFLGFDNSNKKPGAILFAQYNVTAVYAYLRGGAVSMTLAELQALNAALSVTIDGVVKTATINLASATSFSRAGQLIADGLSITGIQTATFTGAVGGTFTGTTSGTTLTITAVSSGFILLGDTVSGTDGTNTLAATITAFGTGTGGTGTYTITSAATPGNLTSTTVSGASNTMNVTAVASGEIGVGNIATGGGLSNPYISAQLTGTAGGVGRYTITGTPEHIASASHTAFLAGVEYDSLLESFIVRSGTVGATSTITFGSGALATSLNLTEATGAVLSQGADAAAPSAFMDALVGVTQNWASFMTTFNPDSSGNANKLLFATWVNDTNDRYVYVCWDNDATPALSSPATASLGYLLGQAQFSGTVMIGQDAADASDTKLKNVAAFACGAIASIDFEETNGRTTLAYRTQSGLSATVTSLAAAVNLEANGYNYYGATATANDGFVFFYAGSISGDFLWIDSYVNQIWLENGLQLALLGVLTAAKSIPYNPAGFARIEAACADIINAALNFGAFRPGVTLSAAQVAAVNAEAGLVISPTLQAQGYFLQIKAPSAAIRAARGSPVCKLWYVDGQSIQSIDFTTIEVQ